MAKTNKAQKRVRTNRKHTVADSHATLERLEGRRMLAAATAVFPDISIYGNSTEIVDGDTTPSAGDYSDFGNAEINFGSVTRTFTIKNTGEGVLDLTGAPRVRVIGADAADFAVTTQPPATVAATNGSTTFVVKYDPSASGESDATIKIFNDSVKNNPFTFAITGTGTTASKISLAGNGNAIANGDSAPTVAKQTDFGSAVINVDAVARTFTISNLGSTALTLSGTPKVAVSGTDADQFLVAIQPTASIAANGGSAPFLVVFEPTTAGAKSATLTIVDNDPAAGTYTFNLKGTATTAPVIALNGNSTFIDNGDVSPSTSDDTEFGSTDIKDGTVSKTFTIGNSGSGALTLTGSKVSISGTAAADFKVTTQPSGSIAAGGTGTFVVKFDPTTEGVKNAKIVVTSNDTHNASYNFAISGTGFAQPQEAVAGGSTLTTIADGESTPGTADNTDFGSANVVGETISKTFTIKNSGSGALSLLGDPIIGLSGDAAGDFSVTTDPSGSVAKLTGSTTFVLRFNPSDSGARDATVSIVSNDADSPTYSFDIEGTGLLAPVISVQGQGGKAIASGDTAPLTTDGTLFGTAGVSTTENSIKRTFTIANSGSANLTLSGSPKIAISGDGASDFSVDSQPGGTVGATSSTSFVVTFAPSAAGNKLATVSIVNNDADTPTYTFAVKGVAIAGPEINVKGNAHSIVSGDVTPADSDYTAFGTVNVATDTVLRTFTIENTGSAALSLTGSKVTVSGRNSGDFVVATQPSGSIAAGGTGTFVVKFDPTTQGWKKATISIANNDATASESPYTFAIKGRAIVAPEIVVESGTTTVADGESSPATSDGTDFGSANQTGETVSHTFTIVNTGSSLLSLSGAARVALSGAGAGDFSVTTQPSKLVFAGTATASTFVIRFNPSSAATKNATVKIVNNTADDPTYTFAITGTGVSAPIIDVMGRNKTITDGDSVPSTTDYTDFGSAAVVGDVVYKSFVIANDGSANLTFGGTPKVALTGDNAADFNVSLQPTSPIGAASATVFIVGFNPSAAGKRLATVSIVNNDADHATFTFNVQGTGANLPDIQVQGNSQDIANGESSPSTSDDTNFGSADIATASILKTFTIENTGSAALSLTGSSKVAISGTDAADFKVTSQPGGSIAASGSATFIVKFDPTTPGNKAAYLTIANNATYTGNNSYRFRIGATATATPTIVVQGGTTLTTIHTPETSPTTADFTDFGSADITGGTLTKTFTIKNTGTDALNLTGTPKVAFSGGNTGDFSLAVKPRASVVAGGTATFVITLDPSATGARSTTVKIVSDDADTATYAFKIQGTGITLPSIAVKGNNTTIAKGDTSPSSADSTDFGTADITDETVLKTFTVSNSGSGSLTLGGTPKVALAGTNASDFSVSTQPTSPVGSSSSTTFVVTFDPGGTAAGSRVATVSIDNNDTTKTPYTFSIKGMAKVSPAMDVQGNSTTIDDGDATPATADDTNFGSADVTGVNVLKTFTIRNQGSGALTLSGTPKVAVGGSNAADFTVSSQPGGSIAAAGSATFVVKFDPTAAGTRSATLSIANNDTGHSVNPYNFTIQGTGTTSPSMGVFGNNVQITDGDATPSTSDYTSFGSVAAASGNITKTFTIKNTGSGALALSGTPKVDVTGSDKDDFTVSTQPGGTVAATNGSTTFVVVFDPSATGARDATISIASDDTNHNPYTFDIEGSGT